jgi:hypothetical protein
MKVTMRAVVKVVPGKMAEYMELDKKSEAISTRAGMPPLRWYRCLSGDSMNTIVYEQEFDSLAAMEAFSEKAMANPEEQAMFAKMEAVMESLITEFYTPIP